MVNPVSQVNAEINIEIYSEGFTHEADDQNLIFEK